MQIVKKQAFARAGLIGNPSDGYSGKTISFIIRDFCAEVVLYEWDEVDVIRSQEDQSCFQSVHDLVRSTRLHGYYGGARLVKATIKRFVEYCLEQQVELHDQNFSIRYQSSIPRQVGLAGSSAIIVATLRALMEFYGVDVPIEVQPSLVLSVETGELGIAAGLQDRVIQIYEGLVYMDFSEEKSKTLYGLKCGEYERMDTSLLPNVYVAYGTQVGEPTEVFHNDLAARYRQGDPQIVEAMSHFASLAAQARDALLAGDSENLSRLIDENFDTRNSISRLLPEHVSMIEAARSVGASAKYAGSGGAIVGIYKDEAMLNELSKILGKQQCRVIVPTIDPV